MRVQVTEGPATMPSRPQLPLAEFFASLRSHLDRCRTNRRQEDTGLARAFNVFDYIRPDENALSDILVSLLRPDGAHGQGSFFLRHFLLTSGIGEMEGLDGARLRREVITQHIEDPRRIDFTVEIGGVGIGIENKPWAFDQPDQLNAYAAHLFNKYGEGFFLVYLSGDGSEPTSLSAPLRRQLGPRFRMLSYAGELRRWLESCFRDCRADKVRWFLGDFLVYLDENFSCDHSLVGRGPMARKNEDRHVLVEHAFRDIPTLEGALACVKAFPDLAARAAADFTAALGARLRELGGGKLSVTTHTDPQGGPAGERVAISKEGWGTLRAVLAHDRPVPYDNRGACAVYFQVREAYVEEAEQWPEEAKAFRDRLIPVLTAQCGKGRADSIWWPKWYRCPEGYSRWDDPDVLLELAKQGDALEFFTCEFLKMAEAIEFARGTVPPSPSG